MPEWVVDRSIPVLFRQVDEAAPGRNKGSDGTIGDADHAARESDHNPESPPPPGNPDNQVDAADITHDPARGADMGVVAESIRKSRDRRVRYVIFNRRIFYGYDRAGLPAFTWTSYSGSDPHTGHLHISVNDVHHDETQLWAIGLGDMDQADKNMATATTYRTEATLRHKENAKYTIVTADGKKVERVETNELKKVIDTTAANVQLLVDRPTSEPDPADVAMVKAAVRSVLMEPEVVAVYEAAFGRVLAAALRAGADAVAPPA